MNKTYIKINKEDFKNELANKAFFLMRDKGYPFKPKHIDYITHDESIYISGCHNMYEYISQAIREVLDTYTDE